MGRGRRGKTQQAGQGKTYPTQSIHRHIYEWSIRCTQVETPPATPHTLFLLRSRPPVRFYTVEALCRYVLSHSTPPFSSSFLIREVHCGKSTQSPAVMQKVCGRHDSYLNPFELKNFSLCFPRFAPPAPKNSFRPIISVSSRPPTLLHTRLPCCTNLPSTLFPPQAPPKSLRWFGTHGLRPCKTATTNVGHHTPTSLYNAYPCSFVAPWHKLPSF